MRSQATKAENCNIFSKFVQETGFHFWRNRFLLRIFEFFSKTVAETCVTQIHKHLMITSQESTKLHQLKPQNESTQQGLPRDYILEDVDQLTKG